MTDTLKTDIAGLLDQLHDECDRPSRMDNRDTLMCDVYIWQEIMIYAKKKYDESMKDLATLVPSDEKLRQKGTGDHTVETGNAFAFCVKVSNPAQRFDKDDFIATVARKFRIAAAKLDALAETTKTESNAGLSKRIIEL